MITIIIFDSSYIFNLIRILLSIAFILQSLEYLLIRNTFSDIGIWKYKDIKNDFEIFPKFVQKTLDLLLNYKVFILIVFFRLLASCFYLFESSLLISILLLIINLLIALRWRGTFNGGSDYMAIIILTSLIIFSLSPNADFGKAAIYYLSFHLASSYFYAGLVKIRNREWRSGIALKEFMSLTIFKENIDLNKLFSNLSFNKMLSYFIILWELLFPLAFLDKNIAIVMLTIGILFHLFNAYIIGINRFFYIWLAAYPVVFYYIF